MNTLEINITNIINIGDNNPDLEKMVNEINDYIANNNIDDDQTQLAQLFNYNLDDVVANSNLDYKTLARFFQIMRDYQTMAMV